MRVSPFLSSLLSLFSLSQDHNIVDVEKGEDPDDFEKRDDDADSAERQEKRGEKRGERVKQGNTGALFLARPLTLPRRG